MFADIRALTSICAKQSLVYVWVCVYVCGIGPLLSCSCVLLPGCANAAECGMVPACIFADTVNLFIQPHCPLPSLLPSLLCVPANPNVLARVPKVDDIARSNQIVIYGSYYPEGKWAAISRASTHARAAAAAARIWARWRRRAESATWQTKLIRCHAANFASRANYADLVDTGIPAVCNTDECRDGPGFPQIGLEKWSP